MNLKEQYRKTTDKWDKCPWSDKKEIEFLQDYIKWLEAKLILTDVNYSRPTYKNKNQLPEDVKYLFNKGVELYQTILNYEQAFMSQEEFIQKMREIEKAYCI